VTYEWTLLEGETLKAYLRGPAVPVEHRMIAGSHERPGGPECRCGSEWLYFEDRCSTTPALEGKRS
jgi:hypothetical protein